MKNPIRLTSAVLAVLIASLVVAGCGNGKGKTTYQTVKTYKITPTDPAPTPPAPPAPPTDPVAPVDSSALAAVRLEYSMANQGTGNSVIVAVLKLIALRDGVALRRLRVSTDINVPSMEAYTYTDYVSVGLSTSDNVAPTTSFVIASTSRLDMGYCPLAGDSVTIQLLVDASALDTKKVTFTVTGVDVSVGNNATQTITDKLPGSFSVLFGEMPLIEGIAGITSRAAIRDTETVLTEFSLKNVGAHAVDLLNVRFNPAADGLKDVKSLKVKVGTTFTSVFPSAQDGNYFNGRLIEVDTSMGNIVLQPSQEILVQLIGDTLTAGAKTEVWADFALVQIHGDSSRSLYAYEALVNGAMALFTTTFVGVDTTTVVRQQSLTKTTTASIDGTFAVMRLQVTNNIASVTSLTQVDCQMLSNDLPNLKGEAWLQLQTGVGSIRIGPNVTYSGNNRFTLTLDAGTTLTIPANGSIVLEVFATAPALGASDSFLAKLEALPTSRGLPDLTLTPPTAPSILVN